MQPENLIYAALFLLGCWYAWNIIRRGPARYVVAVLVGLDIVANALIFGAPRETLSGRMGRRIESGDCPLCFFICRKILHRIEPWHCRRVHRQEKRYWRP